MADTINNAKKMLVKQLDAMVDMLHLLVGLEGELEGAEVEVVSKVEEGDVGEDGEKQVCFKFEFSVRD